MHGQFDVNKIVSYPCFFGAATKHIWPIWEGDLARRLKVKQEIKRKIGAIQSSTDATVAEIGQILTVFDDVNDILSSIATTGVRGDVRQHQPG